MEMEKTIWKIITIITAALLLATITAQLTIREVERRHSGWHMCEDALLRFEGYSSVTPLHHNTQFPSAASLETERFFVPDTPADGFHKTLLTAPQKGVKEEEEEETEDKEFE